MRESRPRRRAHGALASGPRAIGIALVRLYQRVVSPLLGRRCRYHPSCSEYAVGALRSFGLPRGVVLAGWRLLRCNPWSAGGVDHPRDQTLFAVPTTTHSPR